MADATLSTGAGGPGGGRVVANTAFRSIAEVGSKLATFALLTVLGRRLGEGPLGIFLFAMSITTLATTLADFGQDKVLTREVARDHGLADRYFANTLALRLVVGLPVLLVVPALVPLLGYHGSTPLVVAVVGLAVLTELLTTTCFAVYQAFERMGFMPVVMITERWLIGIGGVAVVLAGGSVLAIAVAYLAGAAFGLMLAVWLLVTRVAPVRLRVDPSLWWPLMRAAVPLGIAGVFNTIVFRIDMTMLAGYTDAPTVGNYGVAYRLFEMTLFLSYSVAAGAFPVYARTKDGLPDLFSRTLKLAGGLVFPLAAGLAVLAGPIVRLLFGAHFGEAPRALVLLAPAVVMFPVSYLAGYLMIARDRERTLLKVYGALAVQNIAFNAVLIPAFSLNGAAVSTSITEALSALIVLGLAARAAGGIDLHVAFTTPVVAAGSAALVMLALRPWPVGAGVAGAVSYLGLFALVEKRWFGGDIRSLLRRGQGLAPDLG